MEMPTYDTKSRSVCPETYVKDLSRPAEPFKFFIPPFLVNTIDSYKIKTTNYIVLRKNGILFFNNM